MPSYQSDLAYIHDIGFGEFSRNAAPGLLKLLGQSGIHEGLVLDLGCGSGIWARALTDAGYDVLGIDLSPAMLKLAREHAPKAKFLEASYLDASLPPCAAVTSIGECLGYRFDDRNGFPSLHRLFKRVHDALLPGGVIVFDLAAPGRGSGPSRRHFKGDDWAVIVEYGEDARRSILTRRITTFRKAGQSYRRGEEFHRLNLYDPAAVVAALRQTGFRVRVRRDYGGIAFPKGLKAFVARKSL
jgi:SAM-dependent methyltransferase